MINKYFFRAKISDEKFRIVLRLFSLDVEAKKVAEFTGLGLFPKRKLEVCRSKFWQNSSTIE